MRAFAGLAEASLEATAPTVTQPQFRALLALHDDGPTNAASLAATLGIAPSSLTRLVDRLVRGGLVRRTTDEEDRRAVVLSVSRRGSQTAERVRAWRERELARRFAALSPSERSALLPALETTARLFEDDEEEERSTHD